MIRLTLKQLLWLILALSLLALLFIPKKSFAVDSSSSSAFAKFHVIFPIKDLGSCHSLTECKNYCEDLSHAQECINFAKKKGFFKAPASPPSEASLVEAAKKELGCDSKEACQQFCGLQENWVKCGQFAKKHKVEQKPDKPDMSELLSKAKQLLGCNSQDTCKTFCSKKENQPKCDQLAKLIKKSSDTLNKLKAPLASKVASSSADFKGPGGCNSVEDCTNYCLSHLDECKKFAEEFKSKSKIAVPAFQNASQKAEFCRTNPEKCASFKPATPSAELIQKITACVQTPGCFWKEGSCSCKSQSSSTPSVQGAHTGPNLLQRIVTAIFGKW
jgi:hypothetical protein